MYDLKKTDFTDILVMIGGLSLSFYLLGYVVVNFANQKILFQNLLDALFQLQDYKEAQSLILMPKTDTKQS